MNSKDILNLINKKLTEQCELNFLVEILKASYIDTAKLERLSTMQLCHMFDFHKAWLQQHEEKEEDKPEYNRFIFALKNFVFGKNFKDIKIDNLIINQATFSIDFKFAYKKQDFSLSIPNYEGITKFEERRGLDYELAYYVNSCCLETFKVYETLEELSNNIIKDLDGKIEEIKNKENNQ